MKRLRLLLLVIFILPLARAAEPAATASPPKPLIAVLNAYPPEMDAMVKEFGLDDPRFAQKSIKGFRFFRGEVEGKDVLVVETGMSLVNAAMALQLTLDHFPITHVLFAGVAGGIDPAFQVGDVVIPERWAYHSEAAYFNPDGKGGFIVADYFKQKYPNFGMMFPDDVVATRAGKDKFTRVPTFPADPALLEVARKAIAKLGPVKGEKSGRMLTIDVGGTGVTGPVFLDNAEYRKFVFQVWQARCLDMETTAYAHVCYTNGVPFLAVRALSDLAGGQEGKNVIDDHESTSSVNAVRVLRAILREL
jgi:adenosylhomocysteine nucleosidase